MKLGSNQDSRAWGGLGVAREGIRVGGVEREARLIRGLFGFRWLREGLIPGFVDSPQTGPEQAP